MWSVAQPKEVQQLAPDYLHEFHQVSVGTIDLSGNKDIMQIIEVGTDFEYKNLTKHLQETFSS